MPRAAAKMSWAQRTRRYELVVRQAICYNTCCCLSDSRMVTALGVGFGMGEGQGLFYSTALFLGWQKLTDYFCPTALEDV